MEARLAGHDARVAGGAELEDVRFLAQQLADLAVRGGERAERFESLQELELPQWIDVTGWPEDMAALVPAPDEPEPAPEPEPEPEPEPSEPVAPAPPASTTPTPADPEGPAGDLLARIRDKAAEKGVDLTGLDLKPASTIAVAEKAPEPTEPPLEDSTAGGSDDCPNCGAPLVAGECWECF